MSGSITLAAFLAASSLVLLVSLLLGNRRSRLDARLEELEDPANPHAARDPAEIFAQTALPRMGAAMLSDKEEARQRLKTRLVQAGLYKRHAMLLFLGVKML